MITIGPSLAERRNSTFQWAGLSGSPVFLAVLCALFLGGCFQGKRLIKRSAYWEVVQKRTLDTKKARTRASTVHAKHIKPVNRPNWPLLSVSGDTPVITYPERCVQVVAIDRVQLEDVQYRSGWKNDVAVWGLSLGVPLVVGGALELNQASNAPSESLVNGNPNVTTNFTKEQKTLTGTLLAATGAALIATAATTFGLQYMTTSEQRRKATWYGLDESKCTATSAFALSPSVLSGDLLWSGLKGKGKRPAKAAISVAKDHSVSLTSTNNTMPGTPSTWIQHVLSGKSQLNLHTKIQLPKTKAVFKTKYSIKVDTSSSKKLGAALARMLASNGVTANAVGKVQFTIGDAGFTLQMDAIAEFGRADSKAGKMARSALKKATIVHEGVVVATTPKLALSDLKLANSSLVMTAKELSKPIKPGVVSLQVTVPLSSVAWRNAITGWLAASSAPRLSSAAAGLTWVLPEAQRQTAQSAYVNALLRVTKRIKLPTSIEGRSSFDAVSRMKSLLPNVAKVMTDMCTGQIKELAKDCKTLQATWETRKKAYAKSLVKARNKYLSALAKRVASSLKRKEFDEARNIVSEADPIISAEYKGIVALRKKIAAAEVREEKAQAAREAAEARREAARERREKRKSAAACMKLCTAWGPCDSNNRFLCGRNCGHHRLCPCCASTRSWCKKQCY